MAHSPLSRYLTGRSPEDLDAGFLAYLASLQQVSTVSPEVASAIVSELQDQRSNLKLIASENYCSLAVQLAMGNLLTDKYAEGYPHHRFYAGCENVDHLETQAAEEACRLFGCDHAYVQPHSGADANLVAFWTILSTRVQVPMVAKTGAADLSKVSAEDWSTIRKELGNQRLLGMSYYSGGHLTHGYRQNVSARMFDAHSYEVNRETRLLDYDALREQTLKLRPLILLAGYSSYPRKINFRILREIADEAGSVLMVDMAHFAGLVAGKVFTGEFDPAPFADVVTSTTHKTLRGPRGGIVLCKQEFAEQLNKGCPLVLGGPLPHVMAAKAVALKEAGTPEFRAYAARVVENASSLAQACIEEGLTVTTGGTDNHLMLIDVTPQGVTGAQGSAVLREAGITLNMNSLPFDPNSPMVTSGLRLGTPAVTTLGMGPGEMKEIAAVLKLVLSNSRASILTSGANAGKPSKTRAQVQPEILSEARGRTRAVLDRFPVYPNLDLDYLKAHFCA